MNSTNFLQYSIFMDSMDNVTLTKKSVVATINPFSFMIAEKDKEFQKALLQADILLPDGEGIVWGMRKLYNKEIKKIAGYDIFIHLMKELEEKSGNCFFFGSSEKTLQLIKKKIAIEYPSVTVNYFSPPFCDVFSDEDDEEFVSVN